MIRRLACVLVPALLAGCGVHTTEPPTGSISVVNSFPAHERQIRIVKGDLPPGTRYQVLGKVRAVENFYGGLAKAEASLAKLARSLGADAVINEEAWKDPYGIAVSTPHAEGTAVKLLDPSRVDLNKIPGEWY